jgi:hypothetical protein
MAVFPAAPEGWDPDQTTDIGGAIWDAITGGAQFDGLDYPTQLADLIEWGHGRVRPTARALGVPYSTFRGWLHGVIPKAASRDRITLAHRNLIGGGSEALAGLARGGATLKAVAKLGGENRSSPFYVGRSTWDGANAGESMASQLVGAFLAGASPYELGAVYGSGMTSTVGYMDELDILDVEWFSFDPM